jgi:hypothetical protein
MKNFIPKIWNSDNFTTREFENVENNLWGIFGFRE